MQPARSLYEILQVDARAEPEVLEAAYRRLARKYHPDVAQSTGGDQRMKELNAAYEVLRDPRRRADYDEQLVPGGAVVVEPEPAPRPFLACRQHTGTAAVAMCAHCGAGLCEHCFVRFRPALCLACAQAQARRPHQRFLLPALWFFIVLGVMAYLLANSTSMLSRGAP